MGYHGMGKQKSRRRIRNCVDRIFRGRRCCERFAGRSAFQYECYICNGCGIGELLFHLNLRSRCRRRCNGEPCLRKPDALHPDDIHIEPHSFIYTDLVLPRVYERQLLHCGTSFHADLPLAACQRLQIERSREHYAFG